VEVDFTSRYCVSVAQFAFSMGDKVGESYKYAARYSAVGGTRGREIDGAAAGFKISD
jgi:hypothetical protein